MTYWQAVRDTVRVFNYERLPWKYHRRALIWSGILQAIAAVLCLEAIVLGFSNPPSSLFWPAFGSLWPIYYASIHVEALARMRRSVTHICELDDR